LATNSGAGIGQRDEAELGALHFRARALREGAGGEIQLGGGEQRGGPAIGFGALRPARLHPEFVGHQMPRAGRRLAVGHHGSVRFSILAISSSLTPNTTSESRYLSPSMKTWVISGS
jgi:hypothetical protein